MPEELLSKQLPIHRSTLGVVYPKEWKKEEPISISMKVVFHHIRSYSDIVMVSNSYFSIGIRNCKVFLKFSNHVDALIHTCAKLIKPHQQYSILVALNQENQSARVYLDGELEQEFRGVQMNFRKMMNQPLFLGHVASIQFRGYMECMRLYDWFISESEAKEEFQSGKMIAKKSKGPSLPLWKQLGQLFKSGNMSDTELICKDGVSFQVHRLILQLRSEYFKVWFASNFNLPETDGKIIINLSEDVSSEAMKAVLQWVYQDRFEDTLTKDNLADCLSLFEKYQFHVCWSWLLSIALPYVTDENALWIIDVLVSTEKQTNHLSEKWITERALGLIKKNAHSLVSQDQFYQLPLATQKHILSYLLKPTVSS